MANFNYLTSDEVSALTGISRRVIQERAARGEIPCLHVNRLLLFRPKDVEGLKPRPVGRPAGDTGETSPAVTRGQRRRRRQRERKRA